MRKAFKILLYIVGGLLLLIIGALFYLNSPWGQNFVRGKAEAFLQDKLKTEVHIGHLGYGIPKYIVLENVLLKDQAKDTLLAVGELKIDINMLKLLHKEVAIQQVLLTGLHAHIYRNLPDTNYNFTYIINAFTSNKPKDPNKAKDTSSSSLTIDLDKVKLDDIHVRINDYTGGLQFAVNLDHLDLNMKKMDLSKMMFHIKDLAVTGLQTTFEQDTSYLPPPPHDTAKTKFTLIADNVNMQRIAFKYNNSLNKILFGINLADLQLQLNKFALADNTIDVKKLALDNSAIVINMGKLSSAPSFVDSIVKIDTTTGWNVKAKNVALTGVSFKMDNENSPRQPSGMDYQHMYFQKTMLGMNNFLYTSDTIAGNITNFSGTEQCGLDVKALKTNFNYNPQGASLKDLYLKTAVTTLQNHVEVHYPSLAALQKRTQSLQLLLDLQNSTVGLSDVLLFVPQLKDQPIFKKYKNSQLKVDANVHGFLNDLNIQHMYVAGLQNTEILLDGHLGGLPEPKDLTYNLHISRFKSSRKDVASIVPDSLLAQVRLPDIFGLTGQISGTMQDYTTNMMMMSSDGMAYLKGYLLMSPGKGKEQYDMLVRTSQLNVGRIIKQDSLLGSITLNMRVKGKSFDIKTMNAIVAGEVTAAKIKGYNYHNISLTGDIAAKRGSINLLSVDTNLQLQLTAHADFTGKYPAARADIRIDSIDLRALKLYSSDLRLHGTIHADFPEFNPDYPRGRFTWWDPIINADGKRYYLDSMYVVSRPSADTGQNIYANLDVLQATITGKTPLTKIAPIIMDHINRHYAFPSDSAKKNLASAKIDSSSHLLTRKDTTKAPADYNLAIQAHIIDKPMLHSLLPGLTSFDSIHINGTLSPRYLALDVTAPDIVYGSTTIENAVVTVRGADSAFTYKITADQVDYNDFDLWYANIHGNLDRSGITTNISIADQNQKERFAFAGSMQSVGDSQVIRLQPGLKLNYNVWDVAEPNRIVLAKSGFYIDNFNISYAGQSIKANSDKPATTAPIKIDIANFQLANITQLASKQDTLLAGGTLGGNILYQVTPAGATQVTADMQIQALTVMGDTLGNMQLQVNNKQENVLDTKVNLTGQGNDIALSGSYFLQPTDDNTFKLDLAVNALAVHSFETIAMNNIRNSSGFLRGDLKIQGSPSAPQITGELRTDNLQTTVSQLNSTFKLPAEKIEFTNNTIAFNNFTISDSANNKASLNGSIDISDLTDMQLNLAIKADNWRALHSTQKDSKLFYGDLLLTTNLKVTGSVTAPSVDGDLKILKGTKFTVVNPQTNPEIESDKGIVVFVNMKDTGRKNVLVPKKKKIVKHKIRAGSDFNVNITVDKNAQFSLILDQASGDFLSVKGDATLNAAVNAGGTISLTGSYELHDGTYQLNYNFIKRKFSIQDGSVITFGGDPVTGTNLNVTAVYEAEVPPYDLVERQVADPTQLNYYKQRLPFNVDLKMNGPVLTPRITFDVILPENGVYPLSSDQIELIQGKLSQVRTDTSELNKQVFALLILGRFVSDDPFSSGASSSVGFTALQSVSTFIGEQLNQVAGKFVKGVDISADLATTEDYTTGDMRQRTDLNLAASKRLLNDRLKLTIGNDFELEGPQTNNSQSSLIPTNLAADYLLTEDGKYTTRVYRKAYDEGVLQGYVTETGVTFIVSLDYNHFKNVFKKKPKPQQAQAVQQKK